VVQSFSNPQTLNRYSYCVNNPLKYNDPSGHYFVIGEDDLGNVIQMNSKGEVSPNAYPPAPNKPTSPPEDNEPDMPVADDDSGGTGGDGSDTWVFAIEIVDAIHGVPAVGLGVPLGGFSIATGVAVIANAGSLAAAAGVTGTAGAVATGALVVSGAIVATAGVVLVVAAVYIIWEVWFHH
jgi:hypothetical protein